MISALRHELTDPYLDADDRDRAFVRAAREIIAGHRALGWRGDWIGAAEILHGAGFTAAEAIEYAPEAIREDYTEDSIVWLGQVLSEAGKATVLGVSLLALWVATADAATAGGSCTAEVTGSMLGGLTIGASLMAITVMLLLFFRRERPQPLQYFNVYPVASDDAHERADPTWGGR